MIVNTRAIDSGLLAGRALPSPQEGNKELRGSVSIVGGSTEVPGAVLFAALGAMRSGTGKLKIATAASCSRPIGVAMPEALVIGLEETRSGGISCRAFVSALDRVCSADAVLIGPGMVEEADCDEALMHLLSGRGAASVIVDAGALPKIMDCSDVLQAGAENVVITPHAGEMAMLLGCSREDVEADPLGMAERVSQTLGIVVVMKGSTTFVVSPTGRWRYDGGSVGLATSGSGDVLAGIIAGLAGRGATATDAALWGVFLHGEAGSQLSQTVGPLGFLAREIPGCVPQLLRQHR